MALAGFDGKLNAFRFNNLNKLYLFKFKLIDFNFGKVEKASDDTYDMLLLYKLKCSKFCIPRKFSALISIRFELEITKVVTLNKKPRFAGIYLVFVS